MKVDGATLSFAEMNVLFSLVGFGPRVSFFP